MHIHMILKIPFSCPSEIIRKERAKELLSTLAISYCGEEAGALNMPDV